MKKVNVINAGDKNYIQNAYAFVLIRLKIIKNI